MKWILSFLLFTSTCFGQLTMQSMQPFFNGNLSPAVTPRSFGGLVYWWVSSDLQTNVNVTNWVDRVSSNVKTNGADSLRPTNSATGIGFTGTTWLTNTTPFAVPSPGTFWILISPQVPASNGATESTVQIGGNGMLYMTAANTMRPFASGNTAFASYAAGVWYAVGEAANNVANDVRYFTNKVFITHNNNGFSVGGNMNFTGKDGAGAPYKGKILEIAYYNILLTDDQITNNVTGLYAYAHNTYPTLFP